MLYHIVTDFTVITATTAGRAMCVSVCVSVCLSVFVAQASSVNPDVEVSSVDGR